MASRGLITIALALSASVCFAKVENLGTYGHVFSIEEQDAIASITAELKRKEETGELDEFKKQQQQKALDRMYGEWPPVPGITPATKTRTRLFNPSMRLTKDIVTPDGLVLGRAGQVINPLDYMPYGLRRAYIFIDGRDKRQIGWALERYRELGGSDAKARIVLVAGSPWQVSHDHQVRIFYDQRDGELSRRFGIKHVPAIVRGRANRVEITEVALH